ncbi:hypothetical protein IW262DRAFT_1517718 [Armillaria fumosa]|nr:hypothetical protein IW262DRAFT_1517718 [Armillaria fumosa]
MTFIAVQRSTGHQPRKGGTLPVPLNLSVHHASARAVCPTPPDAFKNADRQPNERRMYNAFPEHLGESYCGYNLVDPMDHPVPEGKEAARRREALKRIKEPVDGRRVREAKREAKKKGVDGAVKTGEAADSSVKLAEEEEGNDGSDDDFCCYDYDYSPPPRAKEVRSSILLLEECGTPIEPEQFSEDESAPPPPCRLCAKLALHTQLLRQPGPLSVRPSERSLKTPSFRIIDLEECVRTVVYRENLREKEEDHVHQPFRRGKKWSSSKRRKQLGQSEKERVAGMKI